MGSASLIRGVMPLSRLIALFFVLLAASAEGNELFDASPTGIRLTGTDAFGEYTYELSVTLVRTKAKVKIGSLKVTVRATETTVDDVILDSVNDPDFGAVTVIDDSGVFGSYLTFMIPFGEVPRCAAARKGDERRNLMIDMDSDGSLKRVHIYNPCAKA